MTYLIIGLVFSWLAMLLVQGRWQDGLLVSFVVGFLQDPLRKLTPAQPTLFVGLALVAVSLTSLTLFIRRGQFGFRGMFATAPALADLAPLYFLLIITQVLNGLVRMGQPFLSLIGLGFYMAPAIGLWLGYQGGMASNFLRRLITSYVSISSLTAFTIFLDYQDVEHPLFDEVGSGIFITFRHGFSTFGASGLWRSSEVAAWHLAAASCFAITLALASRNLQRSTLFGLLAGFFSLLSMVTGRRKSLVQIAVFCALYLLVVSFQVDNKSRQRVIGLLLGVGGLTAAMIGLFIIPGMGADFAEYTTRGASGFGGAFERFDLLALRAMPAAFSLSGGLGLGAGVLAQTGNLLFGRSFDAATGYVAESGAGKILAELGIPGLVIILAIALQAIGLLRRNLRLLRWLPADQALFHIGLLCFGISNIPFYAAASGIYGDPFVLVIVTISFGSFLAIPKLASSLLRPHSAGRHDPNLNLTFRTD